MPCKKCDAGFVSELQSKSTKCVKASSGPVEFDDDSTFVTTCQTNNDNEGACVLTYTLTNNKRDDCSYCTGSLMGQTRSYCLSTGTTQTYEAQFKSRGGTVECTYGEKGECNPKCQDGQICNTESKQCEKVISCPIDFYGANGKSPCSPCQAGRSTQGKTGQSACSIGESTDPYSGKTKVNECRMYDTDREQCSNSYEIKDTQKMLCTYCEGKVGPQSQEYCLNDGNTEKYMEDFKSKGGLLTCELVTDGPAFDDDAIKAHCATGRWLVGGKCVQRKPCEKGWWSKSGYQPCEKCPVGKTTPTAGYDDICVSLDLPCIDDNTQYDAQSKKCVTCQAGKHTDNTRREQGCVPCNGNYISDGTGKDCKLCPSGYGANLQKTECLEGDMKKLPEHITGLNYTDKCDTSVLDNDYVECTRSFMIDKNDQVQMCSYCAAIYERSNQIQDLECVAVSQIPTTEKYYEKNNKDKSLGPTILNCTLYANETTHRFIPGVSPTPMPTPQPTGANSGKSKGEASNHDDIALGVSLGIILPILCIGGLYYYYLKKKKHASSEEAIEKNSMESKLEEEKEGNEIDEEGLELRPTASARFSSAAMMADNPMLKEIIEYEENEGKNDSGTRRGSSTPDFASHYGTNADNSSDMVYGHNPMMSKEWRMTQAGITDLTEMPSTSVSYEQQVRSSITSVDWNPETLKTLEEIENEI